MCSDAERPFHAYMEYEFNINWTFKSKYKMNIMPSIVESLTMDHMDTVRCDLSFESQSSGLMRLTATLWVIAQSHEFESKQVNSYRSTF